MTTALVIGGGPAGLMAAQELATAGARVTVVDAKPSAGRKFLMAGKSGLNLTKDEPLAQFTAQYAGAEPHLRPMLAAFGPREVQQFAAGLEQEIFTGTSGRVFPKAMKASPMLRAWLARLEGLGVEIRTRWRWTGWDGEALAFHTDSGVQHLAPDTCVIACGGASWARLGSDGAWAEWLPSVPFKASNVGLRVNWSVHMGAFAGAPVKAVTWMAGDATSRGEAVVTQDGLEGGGIYSVSHAVRDGADLCVDLVPDLSTDEIEARYARKRKKDTYSRWARQALRLSPVKYAILRDYCAPVPGMGAGWAQRFKSVPVKVTGTAPLGGAISTGGGVPFSALTPELMLQGRDGVFCAGEMLDWEAPTGGYLLTACFATGRWAGRAAAAHLGLTPAP